ncbi:MAG: tRNA uridine-5-carboxymethylaminomethyl(34) synthesis enzyme MnmG [Candidatus Krumholzibacteriia bacterium]
MSTFDVLVIGAGHAGCEAALGPARMGLRTGVLTLRRDRIAFMPCNPAIGGLGKGHLVREIDALGGQMGRVIDAAGIQFRVLNRSKGPAVWSPRAQADKALYSRVMRGTLESQPDLEILETDVHDILVEPNGDGRHRLRGVRTAEGDEILARALVVTTGTFLRGLMHMGRDKLRGGRSGEPPSTGLSRSLQELGFRLGRLKTGTPPRLLRDSIPFEHFGEQRGDDPPRPFSHTTERLELEQVSCWMARTNEDVHGLIRDNLHLAPMYNGQIGGTGPRYCPSIEDKVVRFADRGQHNLFLEPEGRTSPEIYVNGLSTSLPREVQREIVRRISGLENAVISRYGYAVEYDYVPSGQVSDTMETRVVAGLYLAGQINGTSGYEEAAAQGLMAGINAAARILDMPPLVLRRSEAYIGVMIDDLDRMQLVEPYRMFTSRAEFRLRLRIDNAAERLMPHAERYGLLDGAMRRVRERNAAELARVMEVLPRRIDAASVSRLARETGASPAPGGGSVEKLLRTPGLRASHLAAVVPEFRAVPPEVLEKLEVEVRYAGYIKRQDRDVAAVARLERRDIPEKLRYRDIFGLSSEAAEKLERHRPRNIAQAGRIDGVRAADLSLLLVHLERHARQDSRRAQQAP